jgi:mRNA deadenylase 3'-5' endonuclease subunit Ccr4
MATEYNIISYNVLSPDWCSTYWYFKTNPDYLDSEIRLELLKEKLQSQILSSKNTIICLQEVSMSWYSKLLPFFLNLNFELVYNSYDEGTTGVAIAYPCTITLQNCEVKRVGHLLSTKFIQTKPRNFLMEIFLFFMSLFTCSLFKQKDIPKEFLDAKNKTNTMIVLELELSGKHFIVANYHMPCEYKRQNIMLYHAEAVLLYLYRMNKDCLPLILCGDFNSQPESDVYNLVSKNLFSVYKIYNKNEPLFTNRTICKSNPHGFSGCLDYIFINYKVMVKDVLNLNFNDDWLPTKTEPSDHLMIGSIVTF